METSSFDQVPPLTARQIEVLKLRAQEMPIDAIMHELVIGKAAVKKHLHAIYEKLGVADSSISTFERLRAVQQYAAWLAQQEQDAEPIPRAADTDEEADAAGEDEFAVIRVESSPLPVEAELVLLWDELDLVQRPRFDLQPTLPPAPISAPLPRREQRPWTPRPLLLAITVILAAALLGGILGGGMIYYLTLRQAQAATTVAPLRVNPLPVAPRPALTATATVPLPATPFAVTPYSSRCGEAAAPEFTLQPEFIRSQGIVNYTQANSGGAILSDFVRTLAVDTRGLWIGYFPITGAVESGLGFTDKQQWLSCNQAAGLQAASVNDVLVDPQGNVWVATERAGIARYDGETWRSYHVADGLPSESTYGLSLDHHGQVWAATWEGVAVFAGEQWEAPYSMANHTLFNNHVHAIAFDAQQDIWVGHIGAGVSRYDNATGTWVYHTKEGGQLGGDHIRDILVRPATDDASESVWIATADGGVTRVEQGDWTVYDLAAGLPSNEVIGLALDRYQRVWAATFGGVAYFDGERWQVYHTLPATAVVIGPSCDACPINDDAVWTATPRQGLTYSRLPLDTRGVDVLAVSYPPVVEPGATFRPEITVAPRAPYELREDRGDMLVNTDVDEFYRFGAWQHMPVKGIVRAGEPFTFIDYDNPFVAPQLAAGVTEATFTSTWRIWMHTRFVGPPVTITFTVQQSDTVRPAE